MDDLMESTERLVLLAKAGNLEAFGELVERYEHAAIAVALPIVRDYHHAQDVAQECFVSAHKSLKALRKPKAFGPWLLQSVRRRAQRLASGRRLVTLDYELAEVLIQVNGWSDELSRVLPELSELPEHEFEVVNLHYFGGYSAAAISLALDRPIGTVTKQLSRAIKRLRLLVREPQS